MLFRLLWRLFVTAALVFLFLRPPPEPNATLAEATSSLAQALLDTLDIIKSLDERVKALERREQLKREIQNMPNRGPVPTPGRVEG